MTRRKPYETREEWLQAAVKAFRPWFDEAGAPLPEKIRVSCGFPGGGSPRKRIGECWSKSTTADGVHNIFVSPVQDKPVDGKRGVLETVLHELVHAADDNKSGHSHGFRRIATKVGLAAPMTATVMQDELVPRMEKLAEKLGPYPHSAIKLSARGGKQSTRMLKLACPYCGYTVRTTRKWIEAGLPSCPEGDGMEEA